MSIAPRVAVPVPTSADFAYNHRSWPMYAEAVREAGGMPVEVSLNLSEQEIARIAHGCDGMLLPGSPADVHPRLYGQEPIAECAEADVAREMVDRILLEECSASGKPVLGICYGAQSLNIWRGGTLVQDLSVRPVNHAAGASVAVAHSVVLGDGGTGGAGLLSSLVDSTEGLLKGGELRLAVNSSHHQAVEQIGAGLRVAAVSAEDGVIEAIERSGESDLPEFALGVQWHPERSTAISATSRALFRALIEASMVRMQRDALVESR